MSIDIKPCPFCGSAAKVDYNFGRDPWVQCTNIDGCGATDGSTHETADKAIAFWNRRATPLAPTPAAPEGQAEAEEWMRKAIAETRAAASLFDAGEYRGGMETACDEIEARMARDGDTLPRQAAVRNDQAEPTSIDIAKRMYGKWTDEQGIHCNRFPAFSELSTADQKRWIKKARAAPTVKASQ